ncbi:Spy/CpxP family protein refolding chaperone [Mariniflexile ostreae]|uniref:Spy/CpxP family protein refolding chaperone n=1 Tax=Mariniflexile ostreae TaxID=1520892 RepID=A0ABV5F8P3_9FLAO
MKKNIFIILLLFASVSVFAQGNREQIKALKVAFITEKLDLSEQEAQEFWPIYNTYDSHYAKIKFKDIKSLRHTIKNNINTLDEAKAKALLDELVDAENKLYKARTEFILKLRKVLSPKKILLLKLVEDDFNRKLFEQYKKKRREERN